MRADIVPGGAFPDYELTDHDQTRRRLSELQGIDPMILILSRGHFCPKDHQQHLAAGGLLFGDRGRLHPDRHHRDRQHPRDQRVPGLGRRAMDVPVRRRPQGAEGPRDPGIHRPPPRPDDPSHPRAQSGPGQSTASTTATGTGAGPRSRTCAGTCGTSRGRSGPIGIWPRRACARPGTPATSRGFLAVRRGGRSRRSRAIVSASHR